MPQSPSSVESPLQSSALGVINGGGDDNSASNEKVQVAESHVITEEECDKIATG